MKRKINNEIKAKSAKIINSANEYSIVLSFKNLSEKVKKKLANLNNKNIENITIELKNNDMFQLQGSITENFKEEEKNKAKLNIALKPDSKKTGI